MATKRALKEVMMGIERKSGGVSVTICGAYRGGYKIVDFGNLLRIDGESMGNRWGIDGELG